MVDSSRFFVNQFGDFKGQSVSLLSQDGELIGEIGEKIKTFITMQLQMLNKGLSPQAQTKHHDFQDSSIYTGNAGLALLVQKLHVSKNPQWDSHMTFYDTLISNMSLQNQVITYMAGDPGPLVLHILHNHRNGNIETVQKYAAELVKYASWSKTKKLDNEVLYGRAGYLYALLLVKQIQSDLVPNEVIQQIVNDIIEEGLRKKTNKSALPLFYKWYGEEYVGAGHGYVGILFMILQAKTLCPGSVKEEHEQIILSCLDSLLTKRFSSGNLPPCIGDVDDRLIHFCHGAPGAIHLYALAYKMYKKPSYMDACVVFADNVWSRGLLKRGYGLCHGVGGNAYAFLCMFQLTGEEQYLWKAVKFTEFCLSYGEHGCRIPDTPYSLFEGLGGTLYFLHDMLMPKLAMFPAFQLVSYS